MEIPPLAPVRQVLAQAAITDVAGEGPKATEDFAARQVRWDGPQAVCACRIIWSAQVWSSDKSGGMQGASYFKRRR